MKYISITGNKIIEGDFGSDKYKIGTSLEDLREGYLVLATSAQVKFHKEYPFATAEEIYNRYIDPERIKSELISKINKDTKKSIVSGYSWKGMNVKLSLEDQSNYRLYYDRFIRDGVSYQCRFSTDSGTPIYYTIETASDNEDFYKGMVKHIESCIQKGWKRKDEVLSKNISSLYKEYSLIK